MNLLLERYGRRALALGILLLVLTIAWLAVVQPIAGAFAEQSDEIAQSALTLAHYQAEIASRKSLLAELSRIQAEESVSAGLVEGGNDAIAAANMQGKIKALIEGEQGQVRSAQNLPTASADGFERLAIQYDISLPLSRLENTAYRLETQTPYLFLDHIDIRMPAWPGDGTPIDPPPLQINWVVGGYRGAGRS